MNDTSSCDDQAKTGSRFLVIDDEKPGVLTVAVNMEDVGYELLFVPNRCEDTALFQKSPPELILTDIIMPRCDRM